MSREGAAPALQDLRAGHVAMMFDIVPFALQHIKEGRVRGLAVPDYGEVGYPDVQGGTWFTLLAPANTPPAIIDLLNKEGREAFTSPDVREQREPRGVTLVLGSPQDRSRPPRDGRHSALGQGHPGGRDKARLAGRYQPET